MIRDPRRHRRYTQARAAWLARNYAGSWGQCCLCGRPVNTSLPGLHPLGPTVEHTLPVRTIRALSDTDEQALTWALDESLWALAHKRCQDKQAGEVTAERWANTPLRWQQSRVW